MRYKAVIEYDGNYFYGFQRQALSSKTVQETLEKTLLRLTLEEVTVICSGRTDSGVHAKGQVIHFDLSKEWPLFNLQQGMNTYLDHVAIISVESVSDDFHARFSAKQRSYEYHILNRAAPPVLEESRVWRIIKPIDAKKMQEAADVLCGFHNFNAFRSSACCSNKVERSVDDFFVEIRGGEKIVCTIRARAFLHNQVRIMMGALVWYAVGKISLDDIKKALETGVRGNIGPTAPACGLYFMDVRF